jgi:predicted nuclease of predicted toxin-antitoxin system
MTPRLLVNENFPAPAVMSLRTAGLDVLAIGEATPGMLDTDVLTQAVRERRWLITFDTDYGELLFARHHEPPPVVVLLRVHSYKPANPAGWLLELIAGEKFREGMFYVYDGESLRSRPFLRNVTE